MAASFYSEVYKNRWYNQEKWEFKSYHGVIFTIMKNQFSALRPRLAALLAVGVFLGINHASAALDPISGVTATSNAISEEGNPGFTVSDNSLSAGASGVLGASDSVGDSGFNSTSSNYSSGTNADASDFGNFVTNLEGTNPLSPTPVITYDLGNTYNVSDLLIWNFSQFDITSAGALNITVLSSLTGLPASFTTVGTYNLTAGPNEAYNSPRLVDATALDTQGIANLGPATPTELPQDISVGISDARYIEVQINSNQGFTGSINNSNPDLAPQGYGALVGINEVNFVGVIPEPSTFAMLGLGLLGLIAWQRKRAACRL
jgi:hypothetical protein